MKDLTNIAEEIWMTAQVTNRIRGAERIVALIKAAFNESAERQTLRNIQDILYRESDGTINPDKEWTSDEIERIAEELEKYTEICLLAQLKEL